MSASKDSDELPVVLPSTTQSALSLSLHPLPILNISEHFTRTRLQTNTSTPFVLGALLGTQIGRDIEIVNTFELAMDDEAKAQVDHGFLVSRKDQYKQVFPSLEVIGWYTVATEPTREHIALHEQFIAYTPTPVLLLLQPTSTNLGEDSTTGQALPVKAYEPTVELRDRKTHRAFIEARYDVQTGEAERIAVDWTARGGGGGTSLESHLHTQKAAIMMLHDRVKVILQYVSNVAEGKAPQDFAAMRAISALMASVSRSELPEFRDEFNQEYDIVELTACLAAWTQSTNAMNDVVDKHVLLTARDGRDEGGRSMGGMRRAMRWGPGAQMGGHGVGADWERFH